MMTDESAARIPRVAVLGLGEAGAAIAAGLLAGGADVVGFDPRPDAAAGLEAAGLERAATAAAAARTADVVLSVNAGTVAEAVAHQAVPQMGQETVYADLNTAAPELKRVLDAYAARHGVHFADVALLSPVPSRGLATQSLAAGPGAAAYAAVIRPLGGRVEVVDGPAGAAAARKLLRSVVMKGLAAAVLESLAAARAAGCEEWLRADLAAQFGAELVERLETGSRRHAARRIHEMDAARDLLTALDVPPHVTGAARQWLAAVDSTRG
jgi:3-hydroxyisobutyrate dehydrogenase-like beta-hydroxyacid dehydrogenase